MSFAEEIKQQLAYKKLRLCICPRCGESFAVTRERQRAGRFYCPRGHAIKARFEPQEAKKKGSLEASL